MEHRAGLARLPIHRLIRDAGAIAPVPIQRIDLRHHRVDLVGLRRPAGLQALQQALDSVTDRYSRHHAYLFAALRRQTTQILLVGLAWATDEIDACAPLALRHDLDGGSKRLRGAPLDGEQGRARPSTPRDDE